MADDASFAVKLIDRLSAPARAMAAALKALRGEEAGVAKVAKEAQAATAAAGNAIAAAGARASAAAAGFNKAAAAMKRMSLAGMSARSIAKGNTGWNAIRPGFRTSQRGVDKHPIGPVLDRQAQGFSLGQKIGHGVEDMMRWNSASGQAIEKWQDLSSAFMRTPFGFVLGGLAKIGGAFLDILGAVASALFSVGKLTVALGALAAIGFTKMVVEMGAFADRSKRALSFITGSDALGRKEFGEAVQLAKELGTNVEDTVAHYSKLRSMQFSAVESAGLVRLSTDLKAITGDSQAAERALTAMTQIKAKGKLQSEELVGQLAEAGVSTVLVYKELEKILGTDRKGVLGKLQKGQIDSETGLVAIVRALKQKYHVKNVGVIGEQFAAETIGGLWESLKNAPARMFMRIGEQINTQPVIKALQTMRDAIEGAFQGGSAVAFVNAMVAGIAQLIPMVIAFSEGFAAGLDGIAKALSFGAAGNVEEWARGAGASVAKFYENVINVGKKAVPAIGLAIQGLFEGLDVNRILEDLKGFDWKQFGADLVVIAEALGTVIRRLSKFVTGTGAAPAASSASEAVGNAFKGAGWKGEGGWKKTLEMFGIPGIGNLRDLFYGAEPSTNVRPVFDPATAGGMTNHITIPLTVNATDGDDAGDKARDGAKRGTLDALREFLQGDAAQASG